MENQFTDGPEESTEGREYFSTWESALSSWGPLNDRPAVIEEVRALVNRIAEINGEVTGAFIPRKTRPYVAVLFANDSTRAGAWIHVGFVDHLIPLPGAKHFAEKGYYQSRLSTFTEKDPREPKTPFREAGCPNCPGVLIAITASCSCGWSPSHT